MCSEELDADHPLECERGPMRTRRHDDIADIVAEIGEETGGIARREVFVPELCREPSRMHKEAWLDVWLYGIPEMPDVLVDVTVRHPRAKRYRPASERQAGVAAARAEAEKDEKYVPAGGRSVWTLAFETWGRLGQRAEDFLLACAAAAARRAHRRGRVPGGELRRWRMRLDASLHRSVAAQIAAAEHGLPGRARWRRQPLDITTLEETCPLHSGSLS